MDFYWQEAPLASTAAEVGEGKEGGGVVVHGNGSPYEQLSPGVCAMPLPWVECQADTVGPCEGGKADVFPSPSQSSRPFIPLLQTGKLSAPGICRMS